MDLFILKELQLTNYETLNYGYHPHLQRSLLYGWIRQVFELYGAAVYITRKHRPNDMESNGGNHDGGRRFDLATQVSTTALNILLSIHVNLYHYSSCKWSE